MTPQYSIATAFFISVLIAPTWILLAVLSRWEEAIYFPMAVRYLGTAIVLAGVPFLFRGWLPRISLRLLHAAITVAGLAYFLSPVLCFFALRRLPSGFVALVFATVPMWFILVAYGAGRERLPSYFVLVAGLVLLYLGVRPEAELRGNSLLGLICLAGSVVSFVAGVWVSKRLFWLHSAVELNFWSMMLASGAHWIMGLVNREANAPWAWSQSYWIYLMVLTLISTGLPALFYRVEAMGQVTTLQVTLCVPLFAILAGWRAWGETPVNALTLLGAAAVLAVLGVNCLQGRPSQWLCHMLHNDKRQGDRLACILDAFLRLIQGGSPTKIQVVNLSIGGLGFRSLSRFEPGQKIAITVPLARNLTSVTLTGRIVHVSPSRNKDFPWIGGIEFEDISLGKRQSVVEFLARIAQAEEEGVRSGGALRHG